MSSDPAQPHASLRARRRAKPAVTIAKRPQPRLPLEWKFGLVLLLIAVFLVSGFYDTIYVQVLYREEVDRSTRIVFSLMVALCIGAIAVPALFGARSAAYRLRERPSYEWPLKGLMILTPLWCAIGLVNGWPLTYVVGDVFLLTVLPVTYFLLTQRPMRNPKLIFGWIYGAMMVMAVLCTILVVYHNLITGHRDKMSLDGALGPIFYVMLKNSPLPIELVLIPIFILGAVLTTKRGTWLGVVVVTTMALVMRPGLRRPLRIVIFLIMMIGIVAFVNDQWPDYVTQTRNLVERRIDETKEDISGPNGDLSKQGGGRVSEDIGVIDALKERGNAIEWATGLGLGAVVTARNGRTRHHIHATPSTFLARTGLIGFSLWITFMLLVAKALFLRAMRPQTEWNRVQFLFWLGIWISSIAFSLKSQAFWGNAGTGIQVAYLTHLCREADLSAVAALPVPKAQTRRALPPAIRRRMLRAAKAPSAA